MLNKLVNWYFSKGALPYWCVLIFDCLVVWLSGMVCYTLDHGVTYTIGRFWPVAGTLLFYLLFYVLGFRIMHTYSGVLRYSTFADVLRVGTGMLIGAVLVELSRWFLHADEWLEPIRVKELVFTFILGTMVLIGVRIVVKVMFDAMHVSGHVRRVFIYGINTGGVGIAKAIRAENPARFVLKGFVSDSKDLPGKMMMGVRVHNNDSTLLEKMKEAHVKTLLVSPLKREEFVANHEMVDSLVDAGISLYMMSSMQPWDGKSDIHASQLQEVQIEDLLPRDEITVDLEGVERTLRGKRVLVTGAAGSIGSELVRQVAGFGPESMVLIDQAETPQHTMRLMMAREFPEVKAQTIVTTICRESRMEEVFRDFCPQYVFHAAAYKHVPMMEDNPSEGVQNNVEGTRILADLSVKYGVEKFVMISTDKAVNPTNVMGCSKRICEMYVQSLDKAIKEGQMQGVTQFVTTRFGNVLGSNGSVIPLFREQIRRGGPVTVTHPDIIRYFMLIPEACKLVLEAGAMGKGGEIFVFDMGQPVKIVDLARRMIRLSGAEGVEIEFTGLRDGEKLYEEVLADKEQTQPTFNKSIQIASVREYDFVEVREQVQELVRLAEAYDDMQTVAMMKRMVPEYKSRHSKYEALDGEKESIGHDGQPSPDSSK